MNEEIINMARAMVIAHQEHESMLDAVYAVMDIFPQASRNDLILLWVGVNAKHRAAVAGQAEATAYQAFVNR